MASSDLNAEMYNMIQQFNDQRESICDAECQNDKEIRAIASQVNDAEENLKNNPENLLNLQRELSTRDSQYKSTFNENIKTMANAKVEKLQTGFNDIKININNNLNYLDTQNAYKNSISDLTDFQVKDLKKITQTLADDKGGVAVNRRLASFYSQETSLIDWVSAYSAIIYWILFSVQLIAVLVLFFKNPNAPNKKKIILGILVLLIIPLFDILSPFFSMVAKIFSLFPTP
jgi:hypothetical protein